jgi:periplasmic divalent cation tolerance protein
LAKRKSEGQGVLLLTTVASQRQARKLAKALLTERLCACVSILPRLESLYWWNGRIEASTELLLLLKTTRRRAKSLERRLGALHPYEIPEILVVEPSRIAPAYARWLSLSVR